MKMHLMDMHIECFVKEGENNMDANRAKAIAYNAIVMWREDSYLLYEEDEFKKHAMCELDITEEEYNKIMGEE